MHNFALHPGGKKWRNRIPQARMPIPKHPKSTGKNHSAPNESSIAVSGWPGSYRTGMLCPTVYSGGFDEKFDIVE